MEATSPFSCGLVENSFKHKWFLQTVHSFGVSLASNDESLRRYRDLWLPLVNDATSTTPDVELIPPVDIAWLWHCHRLAPKEYLRYVEGEFKRVLEANPPFALQLEAAATMMEQNNERPFLSAEANTRHIWGQKYPNEPFFLFDENDKHCLPSPSNDSKLLSGFDLLASLERQATFLWQVSGERFQDEDFLQHGMENYIKFLKLKPKAQAQRAILVPTYQIDLMWHTHILSSITLYNKDCKSIMGATLHHDDSLNDRTEGGVLDVSFRTTKNLWRSEYGEEYEVYGGMYRGEPPAEYFESDWDPSTADPVSLLGSKIRNVHLVGKVGATSTSPDESQEKVWAGVTGKTSDGSDAFVATDTTLRRNLLTKERKYNYILGKTDALGVGYYHLETREANEILKKRVEANVRTLEVHIACDKACCCAPKQFTVLKEKKLEEYKDTLAILDERLKAPGPDRATTRSTNSGSDVYYGTGGVWLYPDCMWLAGGGACGGAVACSGGACGGSACGGGGCGGGGCGG